MEEKNIVQKEVKEKTIKRPWQANVLIWFISISFFAIIFIYILGENNCGAKGSSFVSCEIISLFFQYFIFTFPLALVYAFLDFVPHHSYSEVAFFISISIIILIFVFNFLLLKSFLNGKKLLINIFFTFYFFELIFSLFMFNFFIKDEYLNCSEYCASFQDFIFWALIELTIVFILYLSFKCLKHPYYNQKNLNK